MIFMKPQFCTFKLEWDNYNIKSNNHEIYLQRVLKSTLSPIDFKRCYLNEIENTPWG